MIKTEHLSKRYDTLVAVDDVSFEVRAGEVLGFLGPNGAGKTTTMRMLAGFITPTSGRASICGYDVERDALAAKSCLGYLPEGAPAYGEMTVRGFLEFIADLRALEGARRAARLDYVIGRLQLAHVLEQSIETLSKGFRRRVGLAQAIMHDPPVLVLDEPTDGLDPNQKHAVRALLRAMAPDKAIVISTHLLEEVEAICTRAVIIDKGRIVADGTPAELVARSRHHNAVTLVLPPAQVQAAKTRLAALAGVAAIEETTRPGGLVEMTAFPKSGALLIEDVSAIVVAEKWDVKELYAEAGRLDEVFRAITTHDAERAKEARA